MQYFEDQKCEIVSVSKSVRGVAGTWHVGDGRLFEAWAASIHSHKAEYKERRLRKLLGVRMWKASMRIKK